MAARRLSCSVLSLCREPACGPQLINDLVAILVDPCAGATDSAGRARHHREDVLHPHRAEILVRYRDHRVSRDILLIAEDLLNIIDWRNRGLDTLKGLEDLGQIMFGDPATDDPIYLLDMLDAVEVGLEARIIRRTRAPVRSSTRLTILGVAAESATQRPSRVR